MVEPGQDAGAIRFAIIVSLMVLSAGVASFPPARDFRVFLGAALLGGAWVIAIGVIKYFEDWAITSSFFILDFAYIAGFYWISRGQENEPEGRVKERNWAGYVAAILTILVVVEIAHALATNDFALKPLAIVVLGALGFIIFWGFARGFGYRTAMGFALLLLAVNLMAMNFFLTTSNGLTAIAFGIIIWRALRSARNNIVAWSRTMLSRKKDPTDQSKRNGHRPDRN